MDNPTIKYYLDGLPNSVKAIININSNQRSTNTGNHIEVTADDFAIPDEFAMVFSGPTASQAASNNRYKTTIHLRNRDTRGREYI